MHHVSSQQPIDRRSGQKFHFQTSIIPPRQARFALPTDDVRLDSNSVPRLQIRDVLMRLQDHSRRLMPEDVVVGHDHRTDRARMPEMHVRAADAGAFDADDDMTWLEVLLERLEGLVRVCDPEVVLGVGIDADVGLRGDCLGRCCGHGDLRADGEGTRQGEKDFQENQRLLNEWYKLLYEKLLKSLRWVGSSWPSSPDID